MIEFIKSKKEKFKKKKDKQKQKAPPIIPDQYQLSFSDDKILIFNKDEKENYLKIDRKNTMPVFLQTKDLDLHDKKLLENSIQFFLIFGKIEIKDVEFLILVSKAEISAEFENKKIFKIKNIRFLTINPEKYKKRIDKCWDHLEKLKLYIKTGFYFSYDYPLHLKFQKENLKFPAHQNLKNSIFTWNLNSLKSLLSSKDNFSFFFPVIQGYVGQIKKNNNFNFVLISRRSFFMGGTRYNSRGIDNKGYVANFVESEQIVITNSNIMSYNQIRGSLPFYWVQEGIKARIKIGQTIGINVKKFENHIDYLKNEMGYENIYFFNLLGEKRGDEPMLTHYLYEILKESIRNGLEKVFYKHVDFHGITKETDYSNVDKHIYTLYGNDDDFNYYDYDVLDDDYSLQQIQKNILRSNCLDCLDRTNAVQTKISFLVLYFMLKKIKLNLFEKKITDPLIFLEKEKSDIIQDFRKIWADNGDNIAKIYAGTGATTSSVTRKGDKSGLHSFFDHGIKTISRFYLNNFDDNFKQEVIDCLLNKKDSSIRHSMINSQRRNYDNKFSFGVFSLISCENNDHIEISRKFLYDVFYKLKECSFIFFVGYMHKNRNIRVIADDYIVFETFSQVFSNMKYILQDFEILTKMDSQNFEVILFGNKEKKSNLSYYNEQKAKLSTFKKSLGVRTSFIFNEYSLELFALNLEEKKNENKMEKLLEKHIDKNYDLILIVGKNDNKCEYDLHKNYKLLFNLSLETKKEKNTFNEINLLFSKKMIDKNLDPIYSELKIDEKGLSNQITFNSVIINLHGLD